MTAPVGGPRGLTSAADERTGGPSDLRVGVVSAVSSRGITVTVAGGTVADIAHLGSYNPGVGDPVVLERFQDSWICLGRPVGPGTPTDNASPGTGLGFTMLDGMVLTQAGGVMAASTGALVTVPRYALSFYHPPGHWVMIMVSYTWFCTTGGDVMQVTLYEAGGSTPTKVEHVQVTGASRFETYAFMAPASLGGAQRSYGLKVQRLGGAGTSQIEDHSLRRGSFFAYDLGDQGTIRTV